MNAEWLHRPGRPRLLLFFAGWGVDANPFRHLASRDWDVLCFYDYRSLTDIPHAADVAGYPEKALVGWSFGCAAANLVAAQTGWTFSRTLAIAGTLIPEDAEAGIPPPWMELTAERLSGGGWQKFVRRICHGAAALADFEARMPQRDLGEAADELRALRRVTAPERCVFRAALVTEEDRIIRPDNQRRCWGRYGVSVEALSSGHYPFSAWQSWEEVLACAR